MKENIDFVNWLKLHDYETDNSIPEEYIPFVQEAFEAGQKTKRTGRKKTEKQTVTPCFQEFNFDTLDVNALYTGMPEYENHQQEEPLITALFKFASIEDFEEFKKKVSQCCFDGEKVFDGMQKLSEKQSWYPHKLKASKYMYIDEAVK